MTLSFHKHAGALDHRSKWDMRHLWIPGDSLGGETISNVVSTWIGKVGAWSGVGRGSSDKDLGERDTETD